MNDNILRINNLSTYFYTRRGIVKAVDNVSFDINDGDTLGLVGETGCGKSMTALSILRLVPTPGKIVTGEIFFKGRNLLDISEDEMRKIRGAEIAMIFQNPMASLNPVYTVGNQIGEVYELHTDIPKKGIVRKVVEILNAVGIPLASLRKNDYPHQFSGGMQQRVMIGMGLSCNPILLLADEPTTALDVTLQAQVLDLISDLKKKLNMTMLLITHNLGVIAEQCNRVAIMYAGNIIEIADVKSMFESPLHPYTKGLINCIPRLDVYNQRLESIPGMVPDLIDMPDGCCFWPRCQNTMPRCKTEKPLLFEIESGHSLACFNEI